MAQTRTMDVQDFISAHKLSRFQITIIGLCFLIPDPADQFGVGVTWDGFGHQL